MNEVIPLPTESTPHKSHYAEFEGKKIDVYKLIRMAEKVVSQTVPIANFEEHKLNKYWYDSHGNWIGPQDIIDICRNLDFSHQLIEDENLDSGLREHLKKVLDSDYISYQIITIRGVVVDGMHRLTKAFIDGVENIEIKAFDELPSEAVID